MTKGLATVHLSKEVMVKTKTKIHIDNVLSKGVYPPKSVELHVPDYKSTGLQAVFRCNASKKCVSALDRPRSAFSQRVFKCNASISRNVPLHMTAEEPCFHSCVRAMYPLIKVYPHI